MATVKFWALQPFALEFLHQESTVGNSCGVDLSCGCLHGLHNLSQADTWYLSKRVQRRKAGEVVNRVQNDDWRHDALKACSCQQSAALTIFGYTKPYCSAYHPSSDQCRPVISGFEAFPLSTSGRPWLLPQHSHGSHFGCHEPILKGHRLTQQHPV